jgi:hypothetical protein
MACAGVEQDKEDGGGCRGRGGRGRRGRSTAGPGSSIGSGLGWTGAGLVLVLGTQSPGGRRMFLWWFRMGGLTGSSTSGNCSCSIRIRPGRQRRCLGSMSTTREDGWSPRRYPDSQDPPVYSFCNRTAPGPMPGQAAARFYDQRRGVRARKRRWSRCDRGLSGGFGARFKHRRALPPKKKS